jgi:TusA-related sulfurtransferase
MSKIVDARGLSCPQPVLMTLDAIASGTDNEIQVLVDNEASKENVARAAENKGCQVKGIQEEGDDTRITILKG